MLSLQVLFRLSGFGLISASGLIILAHICQLLSGQNDMLALAGGLLLLVGGLIVCLCLPALFLRQVPGVGIGGLIGFIGFSLGMFLLNIDATMLNVFLVPWLANMDPKLAQGPDGLGGTLPGQLPASTGRRHHLLSLEPTHRNFSSLARSLAPGNTSRSSHRRHASGSRHCNSHCLTCLLLRTCMDEHDTLKGTRSLFR